ncbi:HAD family hydrolase, partial [Burkholderia pseudomallei]
KPYPDVYLHAARTLGVEPARCVVVEDSVSGLNAARAAGMKTIGIDEPTSPASGVAAFDAAWLDAPTGYAACVAWRRVEQGGA